MKTLKLDKLCIAISDFDSELLFPIDSGRPDYKSALSITSLFELAGGEVLTDGLEYAFDDALNKDDLLSEDNGLDPDSRRMMEETVAESEQRVEKYRQETGRRYPPIYRTKISVELEEVSPEETEKFWLGRVRKLE